MTPFLVNSAPVAAVAWHQPAGNKQNQVNKPPNPKASESQELPDCGARVAQTESIHSKTAQEEGVE